MSVLKDARNLIIGNGDFFLADTEAELPSRAQYKAAKAAGTLKALAGNIGGIKGTVTVQIVREILAYELGVPQLTADQTVIREGVNIKCSLSELSLANVKRQIGGGKYSTTTAAVTQAIVAPATFEAITATVHPDTGDFLARPFAKQPVLLTTSVPAAGSNPVVKNTAETVTYVKDTDYTFDPVNSTITPTVAGAIVADEVLHITSYLYQELATEQLLGGGSADVATSAIAFFHPYKDGRVSDFRIFKGNPVGGVTLPYEEITYTNSDLEFRALADFDKPEGEQLYSAVREVW